MKPGIKTALLCVATAIVSVLATAWVLLVFLAEAPRKTARVPFSDLLAEVAAGRVEEIRIHGQTYTFRVHGSSTPKETLGPAATLEQVQSLRPAASGAPAPKILFE